jgi:uncharacterized protein (DUF58 family)
LSTGSAERRPVRRSGVHVRFTRLGLHTAFIAVFATVGGALRGFNLLLILAGLLLGLLLIQWRLCRRSLESVQIDRLAVDDVFAGSVFTLRFDVRNVSRYLPAWLIMIRDRLQSQDKAVTATGVCGLGQIPPRRRREAYYECCITQRGRYRLGPIVLSSGFPFGLLEAKRSVSQRDVPSVYVYPSPLPLKPRWQGVLQSRSDGSSSTHHRSGPTEGDFYGLREWQSGDSRRWIHWRTTARIGEPAVRQFEQQRRFDICLLVDLSRAADENEEAVERTVRLAASLAMRLAATPTNRICMVVNGREIGQATLTGERTATAQALRLLAEATPIPPGSLVGALERGIESMRGDRPIVVLSSQPSDASRLSEADAHSLGSTIEHLDVRWFDINGPLAEQMVIWDRPHPEHGVSRPTIGA